MSSLRSRAMRASTRASARALPPLSLMLALALAGCGGRSGYAPTADARVVAPPQQMAAAAVNPTEPEMEADGLPAQTPPLMRARPLPDDPSEPFSPNYGPNKSPSYGPSYGNGRSNTADVPAAVTRTADRETAGHRLPDDLPPYFRSRLVIANGSE